MSRTLSLAIALFALPAPAADKPAQPKDVQAVLDLLATPPLLGGSDAEADKLPVFAKDALKDYPTDLSADVLRKLGEKLPARLADAVYSDEWKKLPKGTAHRIAAVKALDEVREHWAKLSGGKEDRLLRDGFDGAPDDKMKRAIKDNEQLPLAVAHLELSELVEALTDDKPGLAKAADADDSKYWRAVFRFAVAQVRLRHAFVTEANLALGEVQTDRLPDTARGLRLVTRSKTGRETGAIAKPALAEMKALADENKGTPFAALAERWAKADLGLMWQVKKEGKEK